MHMSVFFLHVCAPFVSLVPGEFKGGFKFPETRVKTVTGTESGSSARTRALTTEPAVKLPSLS